MKQLLEEIIKEWKEQTFPKIYPRELKIEEFYSPKIKKAITLVGFRRTGKTYLLLHLIEKFGSKNCLYFNFEDERIPEKPEVLTSLAELIKELKKEKELILLLDELQNIPHWSKWTRRMIESQNYFIFISGSSSKLSSGEIPTELRGRTITLHLFPLSFREFLNFKNQKIEDLSKTKILSFLKEYLKFGGFPEIVLAEEGKKYFFIDDYFKTFLTRDIFEKHNPRQRQAIKDIIRLLLNSTYFTITKLTNTLKSLGYRIGKGTVSNYLNYLQDSFFVYFLEIYSPKIKERIKCPKKVYFVDNFFISRFSSQFGDNKGRLMENIVFQELLKKSLENPLLEIYYWKDYQQREVDFVIKEKFKITQLIQVSFINSFSEIKEREIVSLIKASKILDCNNLLVITWDYEAKEKFKDKTIKFIPLWKWLLEN